MIVATEFELGQTVYPIHQRWERTQVNCPVCDGTGRLKLVKGGDVDCTNRECIYGRVTVTNVHKWTPSGDVGQVGQVRFEITSPEFGDRSDGRRYMLTSTGVGSGTLWNEDDLCASPEDAVAECELRNINYTPYSPS